MKLSFELDVDDLANKIVESIDTGRDYDKLIYLLIDFDPDYDSNVELFKYLAEWLMKVIDIEDIKEGYEEHSEEFLELLDEIEEYKKVLEEAYKERGEDDEY